MAAGLAGGTSPNRNWQTETVAKGQKCEIPATSHGLFITCGYALPVWSKINVIARKKGKNWSVRGLQEERLRLLFTGGKV